MLCDGQKKKYKKINEPKLFFTYERNNEIHLLNKARGNAFELDIFSNIVCPVITITQTASENYALKFRFKRTLNQTN